MSDMVTGSPQSSDKSRGHLAGMNWPATKKEIIDHLRKKNAPAHVVKRMNKELSDDRTYHGEQDVMGV